MFVITYLDGATRKDFAGFTQYADAQRRASILTSQGYVDVQVEEKGSVNVPSGITEEVEVAETNRLVRIAQRILDGDDELSIIALNSINLPKVDAKIDSINTLAEAKVFFKLVARFLVRKFSQIQG